MVHAIVSEGEMQLYISPIANLFYIGERRDGHVIIQRSNAIGRFSRNGAEFSTMPKPLCQHHSMQGNKAAFSTNGTKKSTAFSKSK